MSKTDLINGKSARTIPLHFLRKHELTVLRKEQTSDKGVMLFVLFEL